MLVLTYCNQETRELHLLLDSLGKKRIPFECDTIPGKFSWDKVVQWQYAKALKHMDKKLVFVDAWDSLFVGDAEELEYQLSIKPLTFCGSKRCWPNEDKIAGYDKVFPHTRDYRWRYLNGGTMCGTGREIYQAIDIGNHFAPVQPPVEDGRSIYHQDNDQRFWTDILLSKIGEVDVRCEIFQNLACLTDGETGMWHGRFRNHVTGTFPQFIHAAAKTWDLIPEELYAS